MFKILEYLPFIVMVKATYLNIFEKLFLQDIHMHG